MRIHSAFLHRPLNLVLVFLIFLFFPILAHGLTYTVINTNDGGVGSLRQALIDANANSGVDQVQFTIPGVGVKSIQLTSNDLVITEGVLIDGTTQSGFTCTPLIEIWGSAGSGILITSTANGCTIRSLCINRCQTGIYMGSNNNSVEGCFIGTNPAGTAVSANLASGILVVTNANNNIIGSSIACRRNVISGNSNHGIEFQGSNTNTTIQGNYLGTDVTGLIDLGNANHGIKGYNCTGLVIGGNTAALRNVIAGNNLDGMDIETTSNLTIQGNYVGIGSNGTTALGNSSSGITVRNNCSNVLIGGSTTGTGNVVGSNGALGIQTISSTGVVIKQNYIGVTASGLVARGNGIHGVQVQTCPSTIIGGDRTTEGNIISNSGVHGINYDPAGDGAVIQGNLIGTDLNGTAAFGNGVINIVAKSNNMTIGGSTANLGNVIVDAKNSGAGVGLLLANANNAIVRRNKIGIGLDGITALGNRLDGINISVEDPGQSANNTIVEYNTIAYNQRNGVTVGLPLNGYSGCENENSNRVVWNSIFCNVTKGIDLALGSCNDGNNGHTTPTLNSGTATNFFLQGTSQPNDSIHIYAQGNCPSCSQGKTFIAGVKADGAGNWSYSTGISMGGQTTVTATDASNNTSEFATCITLPVSYLYFKVEKENEGNILLWATANEEHNRYFEVQRSTDGIHFETIGIVDTKENSQIPRSYSYSDAAPGTDAKLYYRLKQVDTDGAYTLSKIVSLSLSENEAFTLYPIPAHDQLFLATTTGTANKISILDMGGKIVFCTNSSSLLTELNVQELAPGLYILEISSAESIQTFHKKILLK